ncbi:MAG: hypothetical protein ACFFDQ_13560 [Candidatus Thorarchaeota archaeon]
MIELEVEGIISDELGSFLDNMNEIWNSTKLTGKMSTPIFQTSPIAPMWVYVFLVFQSWTEGIRNLILIIEHSESNLSYKIHVIGSQVDRFFKIKPSKKLEREVTEFLVKQLSLR